MRQKIFCYEFSCSEESYIENARSVTIHKNGQHVEGFYESKVPLVFRAVYELGTFFEKTRKEKNKKEKTKNHVLFSSCFSFASFSLSLSLVLALLP